MTDSDYKPKLKCPICGSTVINKGGTPICPVHGSEPFERRTEVRHKNEIKKEKTRSRY